MSEFYKISQTKAKYDIKYSFLQYLETLYCTVTGFRSAMITKYVAYFATNTFAVPYK